MSNRNIFYIVGKPGDDDVYLCVLEPRPGEFTRYKTDVASLSRLILEAAPHVHGAIAAKIADQTPPP